MTPESYSVYLGGPPGHAFHNGSTWRDYIASELPEEIGVLSPLRSPSSMPHPHIGFNYFNLSKASALLLNFFSEDRVALEASVEIGWAEANRVPMIFISEPADLKDRAALFTHSALRAGAYDEAVTMVKSILRPMGPWKTRRSL